MFQGYTALLVLGVEEGSSGVVKKRKGIIKCTVQAIRKDPSDERRSLRENISALCEEKGFGLTVYGCTYG